MTLAEDAYRYLDRHLRALGPLDVERVGDTVRYLRDGVPFAVVRANSRRVHVGFTRFGRARSKRILSARTGRLPFVRHRVELEAPGDVDSELLAWLSESYENAAAGPLP